VRTARRQGVGRGRRMGGAQRNHRGHFPAARPRMGFAALYPSYKVCRRKRAGRDAGGGLS
jgi:hypothetical protein